MQSFVLNKEKGMESKDDFNDFASNNDQISANKNNKLDEANLNGNPSPSEPNKFKMIVIIAV